MDGTRRARHDARPQGAEVEAAEERMIQHRNIHRRHAVGGRALLALDRGHHLHRVELLEEHHRRAVVHAAHDAQHAAEAVEERHRYADTVAAREVLACADPEAVVRDVAVGKHHALREARRSARVLHVDDVVDVDFALTRKILGGGRLVREALHLVERIHAAMLLAAKEENALEVRILRALQLAARTFLQLGDEVVQNLHIVAVTVAVYDEKVLRIGLLERKVDLGRLVVDVERQQYRADLGGREHEHDPVRNVRRPKRDLLAPLDAKRHEAPGDEIDLFAKLVPCKSIVAIGVDHGIVLATASDRLV